MAEVMLTTVWLLPLLIRNLFESSDYVSERRHVASGTLFMDSA